MNSRERFHASLHDGNPDRVPYFEEGIRPEVLAAWQEQGMPKGTDLGELFPLDHREEIKLDVDPHPRFQVWPSTIQELENLQVQCQKIGKMLGSLIKARSNRTQ